MFWVVQKNLYSEPAFNSLMEQLDRQQVQYQMVNVVPFAHTMEPDINPEGPVMVCGATSMSKIAVQKGWSPGYFGDNLSYDLLIQNYGEHMLNHDSVIAPLREHVKLWDEFFLRPVGDSKLFAGITMSWYDFEDWRRMIYNLEGESSYTTLTGDDLVVMSPLKNIVAEYRFFVVDGKVITGSLYKLGAQVLYSDRVDESVYHYARSVVDLWAPNRAFALDIFETSEGFKVGEINAINSAGFYACDMGKLVNAIERMVF